jgi:hypothetical protein
MCDISHNPQQVALLGSRPTQTKHLKSEKQKMAEDKAPTISYLVPLERNLRHNLDSSFNFFISRAENTR